MGYLFTTVLQEDTHKYTDRRRASWSQTMGKRPSSVPPNHPDKQQVNSAVPLLNLTQIKHVITQFLALLTLVWVDGLMDGKNEWKCSHLNVLPLFWSGIQATISLLPSVPS